MGKRKESASPDGKKKKEKGTRNTRFVGQVKYLRGRWGGKR